MGESWRVVSQAVPKRIRIQLGLITYVTKLLLSASGAHLSYQTASSSGPTIDPTSRSDTSYLSTRCINMQTCHVIRTGLSHSDCSSCVHSLCCVCHASNYASNSRIPC
jgi:hypothetical protein